MRRLIGLLFAFTLCALAVRPAAATLRSAALDDDTEQVIALTRIIVDEGLAYRASLPLLRPNEREDGVSTLRVFENDKELGPGGVNHAAIRTKGNGAFSHWGTTLYFSTSDGTDPRTNGRIYAVRRFAKPPDLEILHPIESADIEALDGFAWTLTLPPTLRGWESDAENPGHSRLLLLENGWPLSWPHSTQGTIRTVGLGRYSHWREAIVFSTGDNTDPRLNGRLYSIAAAPPPHHHFADPRTPPAPRIDNVLPPPVIAFPADGSLLRRQHLRPLSAIRTLTFSITGK